VSWAEKPVSSCCLRRSRGAGRVEEGVLWDANSGRERACGIEEVADARGNHVHLVLGLHILNHRRGDSVEVLWIEGTAGDTPASRHLSL
jgi:hypothetical protein